MRTTDPTTPCGWANFLAAVWGPHFPVRVRDIALEYSSRFDDPIHRVQPFEAGAFEGALRRLPTKNRWAVLYNPRASTGRINFTLAHELGHYLLHRQRAPDGFECGVREMFGQAKNAAAKFVEGQADQFASYLLMPLNDFRTQIERRAMSLELLRHCADRYEVSLTAAALKWLEATSLCAAVVVGTSGFVKWCWRSRAARKAGIFYGSGSEVPAGSLAATGAGRLSDGSAVAVAPGVWHPKRPTSEVAIYVDEYEMTISLLVYEEAGYIPIEWLPEEGEDSFDRLRRAERR